MLLKVQHTTCTCSGDIQITGSKSETNRLLILQALFEGISLKNLSNSDDARVMQKALASGDEVVDIHHAGTAMRFLTAYFSIQKDRKTLLTGSARMQERPMAILVEALQQLGAHIRYDKNEGYPPLVIHGQELTHNTVTLKANVSSQYISALMMMGAKLEQGLSIHLVGKITSVPYIKMTLALLHQLDIQASFEGQKITISSGRKDHQERVITVESDWSSASYFYSIIALSQKRGFQEVHPEPTEGLQRGFQEARPESGKILKNTHTNTSSITITSFKENSLQGDAVLQKIYTQLGVTSTFNKDRLTLTLIKDFKLPKTLKLDLAHSPDIAQTIAVTCLGLGIGCYLTGLHTLKIKETDRLQALHTEITKLGGSILITETDLTLMPQEVALKENIAIATYHDHRMAMAFAPLSLHIPIVIKDAGVVSKSYPDFWKDLETLGFDQEIIG